MQLETAIRYLELTRQKQVTAIQYEDGSGLCFNVQYYHGDWVFERIPADATLPLSHFDSDERHQEIVRAFMRPSVPCNPLPFLNALFNKCRNDSGYIATTEGKAIMLTLNMMAHGSLFMIDSFEQFNQLKKALEAESIKG